MNTNPPILTATNTAAATNDIRALKPPVEIPNGWLWFFWIVGLLLLALVAFLIWKYWKRKKAEIIPEPIIPPHVRARQKLEEALALMGEPKPFCILVSDTIRGYLEERFNFHAPDRTTEEFLHELRSTMLLTLDQKQSLSDFLSVCDMVKFARYEPGPPELKELYDSAVRLIDETEPPPAPADGAGTTGVTK